mmetsp:Transcript_14401/g.40649  ORF Transcript_14401/g.40649 Transcript_14401/m.40649 type:complete len:403 (-) Transcript_14401:849-2057(-)
MRQSGGLGGAGVGPRQDGAPSRRQVLPTSAVPKDASLPSAARLALSSPMSLGSASPSKFQPKPLLLRRDTVVGPRSRQQRRRAPHGKHTAGGEDRCSRAWMRPPAVHGGRRPAPASTGRRQRRQQLPRAVTANVRGGKQPRDHHQDGQRSAVVLRGVAAPLHGLSPTPFLLLLRLPLLLQLLLGGGPVVHDGFQEQSPPHLRLAPVLLLQDNMGGKALKAVTVPFPQEEAGQQDLPKERQVIVHCLGNRASVGKEQGDDVEARHVGCSLTPAAGAPLSGDEAAAHRQEAVHKDLHTPAVNLVAQQSAIALRFFRRQLPVKEEAPQGSDLLCELGFCLRHLLHFMQHGSRLHRVQAHPRPLDPFCPLIPGTAWDCGHPSPVPRQRLLTRRIIAVVSVEELSSI